MRTALVLLGAMGCAVAAALWLARDLDPAALVRALSHRSVRTVDLSGSPSFPRLDPVREASAPTRALTDREADAYAVPVLDAAPDASAAPGRPARQVAVPAPVAPDTPPAEDAERRDVSPPGSQPSGTDPAGTDPAGTDPSGTAALVRRLLALYPRSPGP